MHLPKKEKNCLSRSSACFCSLGADRICNKWLTRNNYSLFLPILHWLFRCGKNSSLLNKKKLWRPKHCIADFISFLVFPHFFVFQEMFTDMEYWRDETFINKASCQSTCSLCLLKGQFCVTSLYFNSQNKFCIIIQLLSAACNDYICIFLMDVCICFLWFTWPDISYNELPSANAICDTLCSTNLSFDDLTSVGVMDSISKMFQGVIN